MDRTHRRRILILAIAGVVAATCIVLGFWQLQRLEDRRARNAAIERARSRDPYLITSGLGRDDPFPPYTPVRTSGEFDPEHEVLVYGRSLDGRSGHWLATPLIFDDGTAALVVRGWVPFEYGSAPVTDAAPPPGELMIHGFLLPDEGTAQPDEDGIIGRLNVEWLRRILRTDVYRRPIQLTDQAVRQPGDLPIAIGWPELSDGPHLSYATQWFSFAAIAVVGAGVLLRRERRGPTPAAT